MVEYITQGNFVEFWHNSWLALAAFGATWFLAAVVIARSGFSSLGISIKALSVLSIIATLPLAINRLGMETGLTDYSTVSYISMGGTVIALVISVPYLFKKRQQTPNNVQMQSAVDRSGVADSGMYSESTPLPESPVTINKSGSATLVINSKNMKDQSVALAASSAVTIVGRSTDNDVVIDDLSVSRQHARITSENGLYYLEDLGSANGTYVNGIQSSGRQTINPGSTIKVGKTEMKFNAPTTSSKATDSMPSLMMDPLKTAVQLDATSRRPGTTQLVKQPKPVMAWLVVKEGPDVGTKFELTENDLTVGRDSSCDIKVSDRKVSLYHGNLCYREDEFVFVDAGSTGGTFVNGESIRSSTLRPSGTLQVGKTLLTLVQVEAHEGQDGTRTLFGSPTDTGNLLIVQSGPDSGRTFTLNQGQNILGTDSSNAIQLTDDTVSFRHCVVRLDGSKVSIHDLASRNGTVADAQQVSPRKLVSQDVVTIGNTQMQFVRVV
ncbi:FHA domain-containing protein [SAR202 cluster bacterium AD-804-J14_MRT_500m]|nr:FHA domain-containing protein [SAR202 cluster bacterium AD-804-J14_MRT_500m]